MAKKDKSKKENKPKDEYKDNLKKFRKASNRHVLKAETDLSSQKIASFIAISENLRQAGNKLTGIMQERYTQLRRNKKYLSLLKLYNKYKDTIKGDKVKKELDSLQKLYKLTWEDCRKEMIRINKIYKLLAVFTLSVAEDVWAGVEKCLYSNGKRLHFKPYGELPSLRAKQINEAIILSVKDDKLQFKINKTTFGIIISSEDRFMQDETEAIISYLEQPEVDDRHAVEVFVRNGKLTDTYRPCYATLVIKKIRSKYRAYIHLTIEGKAMRKYDKNGNPRHKYGEGHVGGDIGTQTVAYTSDTEVGLHNLAERGNSIKHTERQERLLLRKMDRSRRSTNPQNYNEDGTIKKGKKFWTYSKRYNKLKRQHQELSRKGSENRHFSINEDINHLRELGDTFITEEKNASKLQKKAKEDKNTKTGKNAKRKRFGKSIRNRCPGYFQAQAKRKFESTGGKYIEVPLNYRASQYDHTADDYIKKKLSQRMYNLRDGTKVQRDWYSSYLLYCYDKRTENIDKERCKNKFTEMLEKEQKLIQHIREENIHVFNSGIKVKEVPKKHNRIRKKRRCNQNRKKLIEKREIKQSMINSK